MDLEDIMLTEISQTEKDKYCMISLICGIYKKQTNITDKHKKRTQRKRDETWLAEVRVRGGRTGGRWSKGTNFQLQDK